ncbi:probable serine hydrolase [Orussus abietinus]|uniref:probable serine hydrolase n=1 Tax=Orussus abietinus TaxID=222816 RepID=UPI000625E89E|nr:probable serine hydrolase [Orussus abietinus]XP_012273114.1 probable serine hydrolase [Orussus abietinus]
MSNDIVDMDNANGYNDPVVEEIQIPVPWGHISGKWWGSTTQQPIVALHGWQDNAGSFDRLAPMLCKEMPILSIDLPGHGFSSHHPEGQFYYMFWDGVIVLRRLVKYYKWNKVKLLGHSLGGAISFLYGASFPDEVDFLISLDIVSPSVKNPKTVAEITGNFIDKFIKYESLTLEDVPSYQYNDMLKIVLEAYNGSITKSSAEILMKRGMQPGHTPGFHYFSRDPRLKVSTLGMLSLDVVMAYAGRVKCAYLNIRACPGMKFDNPESYKLVLDEIEKVSKRFRYCEIEGTHHVHLNSPERVAPLILEFIKH